MIRGSRIIVLAIGGAALALASWRALGQEQEDFPHERHARLFPSCLGCHEGIPTGDAATSFPAPELCARCHNGTEQRRVGWATPTARVSNLRFSHPAHDAKAELDCSACHVPASAQRMQVHYAIVGQCLGCHTHRATDHFVDADCATCHLPLAQTAFTAQRVAALPVPPSHRQPDFLAERHGRLAATQAERCSTCHTRELCSTCHVNAGELREIAAIPSAQPQLTLPEFRVRYFEPPSHREPAWIQDHGRAARNIAECSTCHTRESCLTCHSAQPPRVVQTLPAAASVRAPGVTTTSAAPLSHRSPFFDREHGAIAASNLRTCTSCHVRTFCEECHTSAPKVDPEPASGNLTPAAPLAQQPPPPAPSSNRTTRGNRAVFHLPNFIARHASAAYARNLECANCHETTVFCRDCHQQSGMGSTGRLQPGFHDAQPLWLLRHGQAARQGLESCASCHDQRDCTQCHSQIGAFQVNPHGKGFDAERAHARNARICLVCHLTDPIRNR